MAGAALNLVLKKFEKVVSNGSGWHATCPVHPEHTLDVSERSDRSVKLKCAGGCELDLILSSIGLQFSDLLAPQPTPGKPQIVKTYDYRALDGVLLYQALRMEPKDFRMRRPTGSGWAWDMGPLKGKRVPYRLPDLAGHQMVIVAEGEKDVDTLWAHGFVATCNVGGAGKWSTNESKSLREAGVMRVIILPDNDGPGAKHADVVAKSVRAEGMAISIINLDVPEKGDVTDWFDAGHTKDDLEALIAAKPFVVAPLTPADTSAILAAFDALGPTAPAHDPTKYNLTDLGNAEAFRDRFGDEVRWDLQAEDWYLWNEHTWRGEASADVRRLAHTHVRQWQAEAIKVSDFAKRQKVLEFVMKSERSGSFDSMLREAKILSPIHVVGGGDTWDTDPWLLGCPNGVLDLKTGTFRAGLRGDHITKRTGVVFDPTFACPRWLQFVHEVFDEDLALINYIQRAIGYSLTGLTTEQCFFMAHGTGSNGKSTMLVALDAVIGEYSHTTDIRTFTTGVDAVPYELAQLAGRRMILTSETRTKSQINEQVLKNFTGGERIEAQHKYGHPFSYKPIGKIWFAVNHAPRVSDESYGFWRRVRMIPFNRTFAGTSDDRNLSEVLRAEGPGILSWAVAGCLAWRDMGLNPPDSVVTATEAYQEAEDPISAFLEDRCIIGAGLRSGAFAVYAAYKTWSQDQGLMERERLTGTAFGKHMSRKFSFLKTVKGKQYQGIGLRNQGDLYGGDGDGADDPSQ